MRTTNSYPNRIYFSYFVIAPCMSPRPINSFPLFLIFSAASRNPESVEGGGDRGAAASDFAAVFSPRWSTSTASSSRSSRPRLENGEHVRIRACQHAEKLGGTTSEMKKATRKWSTLHKHNLEGNGRLPLTPFLGARV